MPREKESYRDNLTEILKFTGGRQVLSIKEVSQYTGLAVNTVKKRFEFTNRSISAPKLARALS